MGGEGWRETMVSETGWARQRTGEGHGTQGGEVGGIVLALLGDVSVEEGSEVKEERKEEGKGEFRREKERRTVMTGCRRGCW